MVRAARNCATPSPWSHFLHWFDQEAPKGKLTEIDAAEALETFRRQSCKLKHVPLPTISAAGPNSAISRIIASPPRQTARSAKAFF